MSLTNYIAVIESCSMAVLGVVRMLREVRAAISSYDERLDSLAREHPDFAIIDSLQGVGPVLAPRILAALVHSAIVIKRLANCHAKAESLSW